MSNSYRIEQDIHSWAIARKRDRSAGVKKIAADTCGLRNCANCGAEYEAKSGRSRYCLGCQPVKNRRCASREWVQFKWYPSLKLASLGLLAILIRENSPGRQVGDLRAILQAIREAEQKTIEAVAAVMAQLEAGGK